MTDTEALLVKLNPKIAPLLNSLAADSPSSEPADQIYFCIARLRILMRGVISMLESEKTEIREQGHELIHNLSRFTEEADILDSLISSQDSE